MPSPAAWEEDSWAGASPLLDTGWRAASPNIMADPIILSGHGGILEGDTTTFTLPKGVSIRFYTPLGARMYDPEANAVEAGSRRWPFIGAHSHPYEATGPGGTISDHVFHPPDSRITIYGQSCYGSQTHKTVCTSRHVRG